MGTDDQSIASIVEDATFDFTMGDAASGIAKLREAVARQPDAFPAWHALAEIYYAEKRFDDALKAAETAHALRPDDLFINTSLSRIWLEKGSKENAERFGAQARMAGWKEQIANPEAASTGTDLA